MFFRLLFFVLPVVVFFVTKRICMSLQRHDREKVLHGHETGRIVRTPEGRFFEVHEPMDEYERWALVQHDTHRPLGLEGGGVDEHGVRRPGGGSGLRNALSRFYYKDAIAPVTPSELAAAHHHGEHEALDSPEAAAVIEQHSESVSDIPGAPVSGHVEDDSIGAGRRR